MKKCLVSFAESEMQPVELNTGDELSEHLTAQNSPILFGCRIGICGTCAIEILEEKESLPPRTANEEEYLEALVPDKPRCRLACQLKINTDIKIKKVEI